MSTGNKKPIGQTNTRMHARIKLDIETRTKKQHFQRFRIKSVIVLTVATSEQLN